MFQKYNHCRLRQHNDKSTQGSDNGNYCYIVLYRYYIHVGGSIWYLSSEVVIDFDSLIGHTDCESK